MTTDLATADELHRLRAPCHGQLDLDGRPDHEWAELVANAPDLDLDQENR